MMRYIFTLLCFLADLSLYAQNDSVVNALEEVVVIADKNVQQNSTGYKVLTLSDSIISNNRTSFTSLIRFNSPIYMKENGAGGVSSASFRGTSASNTAVVWNGININSVNNGQTGFNSLTVNLIDNIVIRSGGGTIKYGSGAIGGTIHLNTTLPFGYFSKHSLQTSLGSFQTLQNRYKFASSNTRFSLNFGIAHNRSENNYKLLSTPFENVNGNYDNLNTNFSFAIKTSLYSKIKFYFTNYSGERGFAGELPNPTSANEKYQNFNNRVLSEFEFSKNTATHTIKFAYLTQEYRYFEDRDMEKYDFGNSTRRLFNYDFTYTFNNSTSIESFSEYDSNIGDSSTLQKHHRKQFSQALIYKSEIGTQILYNLKVRKDFNSDYDVPWVYGFGAEYHLSEKLKLRMNGSKNYRVPTYNDLYWPELGNVDLIPETAKQAEIAIEINNKQLQLDLSFYYIDSKNKIVWTPNGDPNRPNKWIPINISKTLNKGLELNLKYNRKYQHHYFNLNLNYAYTIATDKTKKKSLIFVPKHLTNLNLAYGYRRWNTFYQFLYNGKVFTSEDNIDILSIAAYDISNIGMEYHILKTSKQQLSAGLKVNNVYNEIYEVSPRRLMPNRNFNIHINYKF